MRLKQSSQSWGHGSPRIKAFSPTEPILDGEHMSGGTKDKSLSQMQVGPTVLVKLPSIAQRLICLGSFGCQLQKPLHQHAGDSPQLLIAKPGSYVLRQVLSPYRIE